MRTINLLFVCLLPFSLSAQGLVDGFMAGSGRVNFAVSYSNEWYDQYFVGSTPTTNPNLGTIRTQSVSLYASAGLTPFLDLVVNLPLITAAPSAGYWPRQSGFQDLSVYFRARPWSTSLGKSSLSALVAGGLTTPVSNYVPDAPVAIGHQSTALEGSLLVHWQSESGLFATLRGGYQKRYNVDLDRGYEVSVPDVWDLAAKAGWGGARFYVDGWLQHQIPGSGTDIGPGVPFPSNAVGFTRVGTNLFYALPGIKGLGIGAGAGFTLDGQNIGKSTRLSASIVYGITPWGGFVNSSSPQ